MSIHDLSGAILALAVPVTVTRFGETATVKGYKTTPEETTFEIQASIQPVNSQDMQQLPSGMSVEGTVRVFCMEKLNAGSVESGSEADRFDYKDITYQIDIIKDWFDLGGYYEYFATRVER